eukprot:6202299-Pleurochrysis_carterae.AAC.2
MWAYAIASASIGIRHKVRPQDKRALPKRWRVREGDWELELLERGGRVACAKAAGAGRRYGAALERALARAPECASAQGASQNARTRKQDDTCEGATAARGKGRGGESEVDSESERDGQNASVGAWKRARARKSEAENRAQRLRAHTRGLRQVREGIHLPLHVWH